MRRLGVLVLLGIGLTACAKKQPSTRPVVVEDLLPFGTDVCFPKGMTNPSNEVGGSAEVGGSPGQPASSQPLLPEVISAPEISALTTQPADRTNPLGTEFTPPAVPADSR